MVVVPRLVPGPGMIKTEGYFLLGHKCLIEEAGPWIGYLPIKGMLQAPLLSLILASPRTVSPQPERFFSDIKTSGVPGWLGWLSV